VFCKPNHKQFAVKCPYSDMPAVECAFPAFGIFHLLKAMEFAPLFCSLPVKPPKEEKLAVGR